MCRNHALAHVADVLVLTVQLLQRRGGRWRRDGERDEAVVIFRDGRPGHQAQDSHQNAASKPDILLFLFKGPAADATEAPQP